MTIDADHLVAPDGVGERKLRFPGFFKWRISELWRRIHLSGRFDYSFSKVLILKFAVSLAILAVLFFYIDVPAAFAKLISLKPEHFGLIISILCLQVVLAAWRWHEILKMMGESVKFRQSFDIFVAGAVGNLVMLTSLGGMSVRAFMLARKGAQLKVIAISLLIERFFVLAALIAAFFFSALIVKEHFQRVVSQLELAAILVGVGIFAGLVSLLFILSMAYGQKYIQPVVYQLAIFARNPMRSIRLFLSSIAVLFVGFSAIAIIATSMGIDVPLLILFSVLPIISFLASLPVGFGGWGVREGSMVLGFSFLSIGAEDAIAVSLLYGLAGMVSIFLLALIVLPRLAKK